MADPVGGREAEIERLREIVGLLLDAHVEIIDGQGLPEDIAADAIQRAAEAMNRG